MKIGSQFIEVVKNFSTISDNVLFVPGRIQSVKALDGKLISIFASGNVGVEVPETFGVHAVSKFLGILSLFDSPEIEIGTAALTISSGTRDVSMGLADPAHLTYEKNPERYKKIKRDIMFDISAANLTDIMKFYGLLGSGYVSFIGQEDGISVNVFHTSGAVSDTAGIVLQDTNPFGNFKASIKGAFLNLKRGNYNVSIAREGSILFETAENDMKYYIPVEAANSNLKRD